MRLRIDGASRGRSSMLRNSSGQVRHSGKTRCQCLLCTYNRRCMIPEVMKMRNRRSLAERIRDAKNGSTEAVTKANRRERDLFDKNWKVLLIKHDTESGKYVAKTLCCDEARG